MRQVRPRFKSARKRAERVTDPNIDRLVRGGTTNSIWHRKMVLVVC